MKKIVTLCIMSLLCVMLFAGCGKDKINNPNLNSDKRLTGKQYVQMNIKDYGSLFLVLDADAAPDTVTNFVYNVDNGYYDGLTFHRVVDGFMIQGGDPDATGSGNSKFNLPGEFAANGFENPISHVRGTISMARLSDDYNSAFSQFFIVQEDVTDIDGLYAAFGTVVSGMDIVDKICSNVPVVNEYGFVNFADQPIISSAVTLTEAEFKHFEQRNFDLSEEDPETVAYAVNMEISAADHGKETVATWTINENSEHYLFSCTTDLTSVALYNYDLITMEYDKENPLASYENLKAGELIDIQTLVPEGLPSQMLLVKKPSGATIRYLITYEGIHGGAELSPLDDPTAN